MKKLMIGLGAVAALALAGCVAPVGPTISNGVMGGIVTDHVAPAGYNIDNGVKADRCGRATAQGIVLFTTGDNSINAGVFLWHSSVAYRHRLAKRHSSSGSMGELISPLRMMR